MASPSVINLTIPNSIDILCKYVELAQQKGAFLLKEADLLKRSIDILTDVEKNGDISKGDCLNILIQGVNKGQQSGSYSLADAALIWRVMEYLQNISQAQATAPQATAPTPQAPVQQQQPVKTDVTEDDELASLSEPIPFKVI